MDGGVTDGRGDGAVDDNTQGNTRVKDAAKAIVQRLSVHETMHESSDLQWTVTAPPKGEHEETASFSPPRGSTCLAASVSIFADGGELSGFQSFRPGCTCALAQCA